MIKEALLVGAGAALGAAARYGLSFALGPSLIDATLTTLAINILGCFLMGLFLPGPFWGTGFLGGFTTYSAFALAVAQSDALGALGLVALTLVTCVGAFLLGERLRERGAVWNRS